MIKHLFNNHISLLIYATSCVGKAFARPTAAHQAAVLASNKQDDARSGNVWDEFGAADLLTRLWLLC